MRVSASIWADVQVHNPSMPLPAVTPPPRGAFTVPSQVRVIVRYSAKFTSAVSVTSQERDFLETVMTHLWYNQQYVH